MSKKSPILYLQGFRGLAIILIILFHLCPSICPNGFFGVDVFLVLSGYFLIGKQLLSTEPFSLTQFFTKKALRLFPPMLMLCFCALLLAAVLPEFMMKDIMQQIQWALACIPNIELNAATSDYFAADTRSMPLMHLWYMGCIIQAYIFFALLFVVWHACGFKLRGKLISLGVICCISLVIQHLPVLRSLGIGGDYLPESTYYMTSGRLWEMIVGGCIMVLPVNSSAGSRAGASISFLAGCLLCALSFIHLGNGTLFISTAVLLTALLIYIGEGGYFARILSSRPLVLIGTISFSLYLVHWPIICITEHYRAMTLTPTIACIELLIMLTSGTLLFLAGEKHSFRSVTTACGYAGCWGLYLLLLHTGSLGSHIAKELMDIEILPYNAVTASIDAPLNRHLEGLPIEWKREDGAEASMIYHLGDSTKEAQFVLLGDSHAQSLTAGFDIIGKEKGWSGVYINTYFIPFWGATEEDHHFPTHAFGQQKAETFMRWFIANPAITHVIITQWWDVRMVRHKKWDGTSAGDTHAQAVESRYDELKELCQRLSKSGKKVVLLTDNPKIAAANPKQYVFGQRLNGAKSFDAPAYCCTKEQYERQNRDFMYIAERLEREGHCRLIRLGEALLQDGTFTCMKGNKLMMKDSHHLTPLGGLVAVRLIENDILQALSEH